MKWPAHLDGSCRRELMSQRQVDVAFGAVLRSMSYKRSRDAARCPWSKGHLRRVVQTRLGACCTELAHAEAMSNG